MVRVAQRGERGRGGHARPGVQPHGDVAPRLPDRHQRGARRFDSAASRGDPQPAARLSFGHQRMTEPALFARLVAASDRDWRAYIRHPFVLLLANGELPEACFRRYLVQDYLFLIHFARAWGLAIYKSDALGEMRRAQRLVAATLDIEIGLHIEYCRGWGLSEAAMASEPEAAATIAYTRFVLDRGLAGDRLDLEVALAPCMIGYAEIARERVADPATRHAGNPYREWLEMYAGDEYQRLARDAGAALDEQFTRRGGEGRIPGLAATFTIAARLEADFWQ